MPRAIQGAVCERNLSSISSCSTVQGRPQSERGSGGRFPLPETSLVALGFPLPGVTCNVRRKELLLMASVILLARRVKLALGMTHSAAVNSWAGCSTDRSEQAAVL